MTFWSNPMQSNYGPTYRGYVMKFSIEDASKYFEFAVTIGQEIDGEFIPDKRFMVRRRPTGGTGPNSNELFTAKAEAEAHIDQVIGKVPST